MNKLTSTPTPVPIHQNGDTDIGYTYTIIGNLRSLAELDPHVESRSNLIDIIKESLTRNKQQSLVSLDIDPQEMSRANIYKRDRYNIVDDLGIIQSIGLGIIAILGIICFGNGTTDEQLAILKRLSVQLKFISKDETVWKEINKNYSDSYKALMTRAFKTAKTLTEERMPKRKQMDSFSRISLAASVVFAAIAWHVPHPLFKLVGVSGSLLTTFFVCQTYGRSFYKEWKYVQELKLILSDLDKKVLSERLTDKSIPTQTKKE